MSLTRLERARWMASKGITAFIVESMSKRPLGGHSWMLRNTTDPQRLADWFEMAPDCNYGLWLGKEHVVIDLDMSKDPDGVSGIEKFEAICAEHGIEDFLLEFETFMVQTPSGGYHIYFKTPRPCANKNTFPDLIDVRGAQGYVVGPGSEVAAGKWEVVDENAPILNIPPWLLEYLVTPGHKDPNHSVPIVDLDLPENIEQAEAFIRAEAPAIADGTGDNATYETCCYLRDLGVSETEALRIMCESGWNARCEPPWDVAELEVKIANSYSFGQNRPGCKAVTYEKDKLMQGRPAGGWAAMLTAEQISAMGRPKNLLELVVDNTNDDGEEVPEDVGDDEDPLAEFRTTDEQFWYGFQDFSAIKQVREYIVKGWLIAHGVTALLAKRGTGKSTVALDLACHLACDMDWWGIQSMKDWKVIYICGEDDEGMILNCRAWEMHHKVPVPNDRFLVAKGVVKMTDKTLLASRLKEMQKWAGGARCLVILDTWARATSGFSNNTQEEMDTAYENAEMMAGALNGPMIACFHPPKDGRMTIRGSAVQEDASSAIWELEEVSDGIMLTIGRAKGRGKGNYGKFRLEPVELPGKDFYGDPLEGIVPVKFAGTESEHETSHIEAVVNERRAWAKAVIGALEVYSLENPNEPKVSGAVSALSMFLARVWVDRNSTENAAEKRFVEEWMDELQEHNQLLLTAANQWGQIERQLKTRFLEGDRSEVIVGEYALSVEKKPNTMNTYRFVIHEANPGVEE